MWDAFAWAFALVFLAELGDKTQLAIVALAARGHPVRVGMEAGAAFLLLTAAAVSVGAWLADALPVRMLALAGGVLFLAMAAWSLRTEADHAAPRGSTFATILVAELGDKTQIALAVLAATSQAPLATALGGCLALWTSTALAAGAGGWLGPKLQGNWRRWTTAILFGITGAATLLLALQ